MDKHNAKDYLPLVQALAEGKTIQVFDDGERNDWVDLKNPTFAYKASDYRIKPETVSRTQEMWVHKNTLSCMYPVSIGHPNTDWEKDGWKRRTVTISYEE